MRDLFADRRQDRLVKSYREQQNKKNRRDRADIGQQRMARYGTYLAIAVMNLAVDVLMKRNNGQENQRQRGGNKAFKGFSSD